MKICFISRDDPFDRRSFSGTYYSMLINLKKSHSVEWIGEIKFNPLLTYYFKLKKRADKFRGREKYLYTTLYSKALAKRIERILTTKAYDLIFAPAAAECIAYLKTSIPILYLSDTTFNNLVNYYHTYSGLSKADIRQGNSIEANAIRKARKIIYSSSWAAESAISFYGADKDKISIIDFGANLAKVPAREDLITAVKDNAVCNLLFIGVDWLRKGGDKAYNIFLSLVKEGFPCSLTIIGCNPHLDEKPNNVHVIPFLDKNKTADFDVFYKQMLAAHFLLLPTMADCTPLVFCEAAAFGLPVITTDTGGISSVIKDGVNGFLLPLDADVDVYAKKIKVVFEDKSFYNRLSLKSREEYERRLNWRIWGDKFDVLVSEMSLNV